MSGIAIGDARAPMPRFCPALAAQDRNEDDALPRADSALSAARVGGRDRIESARG
jgi:hypothetical protein